MKARTNQLLEGHCGHFWSFSLLVTTTLLAMIMGGASAQSTKILPPYLKAASMALNEACLVVQQRYSTPLESLPGYSTDSCYEVPGCNVKNYLYTGWSCNATYGQGATCNCTGIEVSKDAAITMTPSNPDERFWAGIKETKCRTSRLGDEFSTITSKYGLVSLFTGFQTGVHVSWPARDWGADPDPNQGGCRVNYGSCQKFEPRFRNWYVVASAGPKNVIVILDVSGSMMENNRLNIMKDAAKTVLETLTFADYFSIITFSSNASFLYSDEGAVLHQATQAKIDLMKGLTDRIVAKGATNYGAGFELAFNVLESSRGSGCHNLILFMTDGAITDGPSLPDLLKILEQRNTAQIGARIFTYALGSQADTGAPKAIACAHKGVFAAIPDRGDLRSKMGQYYQYLAVSSVRTTAVWSEPYIDCCGMGNVTSISLPCYTGENPPQLIGVAGSTVPFNLLGNVSLDDLLESSKECTPLSLTEAEIEIIRGDERCGIDAVAVGVGVSLGGVLPVLIIVFALILTECSPVVASRTGAFLFGVLFLALLPIFLSMPWRLVFFIAELANRHKAPVAKWFFIAFRHLGLWFLDLATVGPAILAMPVLFSFYHWHHLYQKRSTIWVTTHHFHEDIWRGMGRAIKSFFLWVCFVPATVFVPWRTFFVVLDVAATKIPKKRAKRALAHVLLAILDLLTIPAAVFLLLAPWRIVIIYKKLTSAEKIIGETFFMPESDEFDTWSKAAFLRNCAIPHGHVWANAIQVPVDYLLFALAVTLTLAMPHRIIQMILTLLQPPKNTRLRVWEIGFGAVLLALLDILTLPVALVLLVTVYRVPSIVSTISQSETKPKQLVANAAGKIPWRIHMWAISYHGLIWIAFIHTLLDIIVFLPCFLLGAINPARFVATTIDLFWRERNQDGRRALIVTQLGLAVLDWLTFPVVLLLFVTIYRIPHVARRGKHLSAQWNHKDGVLSQYFHIDRGQVDGWNSKRSVSIRATATAHAVIWKEFSILLVDLVCLAFGPLCLVLPWRGVALAIDVFKAENTRHRRMAALVGLSLMMVDILTLPFFLIVLATIYRMPTLFSRFKKTGHSAASANSTWGKYIRCANDGEYGYILLHSFQVHSDVFMTLWDICRDFVSLIFTLLCLIAPWRFAFVLYDFYRASELCGDTEVAWNRRRAPFWHFALALLDILHLPLAVLVTLLPLYRIPQIARKLSKVGSKATPDGPCWLKQPNMAIVSANQMHHALRCFHMLDFYAVFWRQLGLLFADLVIMVLLVVLLILPWRFIVAVIDIVRKVREDKTVEAMQATWVQLGLLVCDILTIPFAVFLLLNPYRIYSLTREMVAVSKTEDIARTIRSHALVWGRIGLVALDVLSLPAGFLLALTFYRMPRTIKKINSKDDPFHFHQCIWASCGQILVDFFGLIAVVVAAAALLTIPVAIYYYKEPDNRPKKWKEARYHALKFCLALPLIFLAIPFAARPFPNSLYSSPITNISVVAVHFFSQTLSLLFYPIHLCISFLVKSSWLEVLNTHLLVATRYFVKGVEDAGKPQIFFYLWLATLTELVLMLWNFVVLLFAAINFLCMSVLTLGVPFWPAQTIKKWSQERLHLLLALCWFFTLPISGFVQYMFWHMPRILALWPEFSSTIFKLCSEQARRLENCVDFYNADAPNVPWWIIWIVWEVAYAYSMVFVFKWMHKYMWSRAGT